MDRFFWRNHRSERIVDVVQKLVARKTKKLFPILISEGEWGGGTDYCFIWDRKSIETGTPELQNCACPRTHVVAHSTVNDIFQRRRPNVQGMPFYMPLLVCEPIVRCPPVIVPLHFWALRVATGVIQSLLTTLGLP